tara:strand:+ start:283 stop:519 length:237 start_codon:yes stop_codon:yes gene_type:complete
MKSILGIVLILTGILLGLYFGVWWAFIGGIVQVISEIRAPELNALDVALGILRTMSSSLIGGIVFLLFGLTGSYFLKD